MAKPKASSSNPSANNKKKMGKKTKHLLSGPAAAAMKSSKAERSNPFETMWSRRKFDVLGRRPKGEERRVGLARSIAIQKRDKTLKKEYEQNAKASTFLDRRIGEADDTLPEFDKAVMRLQRERQLKLKRTSKFNLSDGEDDDFEIRNAHSLSEMDDFQDEVPLDDDDAAFVGTAGNASDSAGHLNLHGAHNLSESSLPDGENHKTKKQVMQEIISKSKYYKAQKAKDKEENDHLLDKLDRDFGSLAQTEALLSLTQPSKMNALKALLNKNPAKRATKEGESNKGLLGSADKESFKQEKPDAYDKLVKEMVLDIRARPSDRTKTPEEIAQEERERLELLEEERQKRMLAADSDEDSDDDEDTNKLNTKKLISVSGDDLGDSFTVDEEVANRKGFVDNIYEKEDSDNSDEDDDTSSEESEDGDEEEKDSNNDNDVNASNANQYGKLSSKDWEQSDDDDLGTDVEEEDGADEKDLDVNDKKCAKVEKKDADSYTAAASKLHMMKQESLPFVIDAPKNLLELSSLLDNRSDIEAVEAINRIRACNSVRLSAENRKKMQVFYGVLLQYFATRATEKPLNIKLINSLVKPLIEMSAETPFFAAICARQRLIHIRTRFCEDIKTAERSSWPSLKTLILLRLWSLIFPCSDFRHVVMTPVILLVSEYLMRCSIVSARDIAIGSFLCSIVLSVTKQSGKFCPEAITYLKTLLLTAVEPEAGLQNNSQGHVLLELKALKPWLHIRNEVYDTKPIDFFMVMDIPEESPLFSSVDFKASILVSVVETLRGFINLYEGLSSFPEIFLPFHSLLQEVLSGSKLPASLQGKMKDTAHLIKRKADENQLLRQPLNMRKQKLAPIKLLNPKFEENFIRGRDYDPDRERAEMKKLKKRLKSEAKGAVRELRIDNKYLFGLKEKERLQLQEEKVEQYGKARAFLQEQESAFKSGQLGKGRKRRR